MTTAVETRGGLARKVTSPGGIEAWFVEDHSNPLVAVQFACVGGASRDPRTRPGLAYLMTGLLDEGAGPYGSEAFHERIEDLAIELRFDADRDHISGSLKTLTRNRDEAFELLRLAIQEPRLDEEAIARVKAQISAGLRRDAKEPNAIANNAFMAAAYPGHPYGQPFKGDLESIAAITRADLVAARGDAFARGAFKIAIVGDIDEAACAAALDRIFGALPATTHLALVPDVPMAGGARHDIDLAVPQSVIVFGLQGLARSDADFTPATVMNHILGGGAFTSRLWTEVREKRGLAYSVYSSLSPLRHAALLTGATSTKNERAEESIAVIAGEMAALAKDGVSAEELNKAKKYLIGSYPLRFDTSTKIARELLRAQLDDLGIDYFERRNDEVAAVGLDDIARVASRLLHVDRLLTVVVGRPVAV